MLWALEGPGMLRWGTHCGTGRLAGSRLASILAGIMMLMLSRSPVGPHLSGEVAGFYWGREILLAVVLMYPVEVTFQGGGVTIVNR